MEFKEAQTKMAQSLMRYGSSNGIRIDDDYILLKLVEEMGELAQTALIYKDMCLAEKKVSKEVSREMMAEELADIAAIAMSLASAMNIDLEAVIKRKWIDIWYKEEF